MSIENKDIILSVLSKKQLEEKYISYMKDFREDSILEKEAKNIRYQGKGLYVIFIRDGNKEIRFFTSLKDYSNYCNTITKNKEFELRNKIKEKIENEIKEYNKSISVLIWEIEMKNDPLIGNLFNRFSDKENKLKIEAQRNIVDKLENLLKKNENDYISLSEFLDEFALILNIK